MNKRGERQISGGQQLFVVPPLVVAAHELKSPLALIRQLSLELQQTTDSAQRQLITTQIQLVAERSLRLTSDLSKAERAQTTLFDMSPFHPMALVSDALAELGPLYAARQRSLRVNRRARLPLVTTNGDLLRRILCNFLDNSLQYADASGTVELYSELRAQKNIVRLGVRDFGPSVSRALWRSLRVDEPARTQTTVGSSGLGLRAVVMFAEVIGAQVGSIRHRDGASFYVDVPISKQLSLL